jgi:hypothetical protein
LNGVKTQKQLNGSDGGPKWCERQRMIIYENECRVKLNVHVEKKTCNLNHSEKSREKTRYY